MITRDMIKRGYEAGFITLMDSPHDDGVVCAIGDNWFYFGGLAASEMSVEEYLRDIPTEDILNSVYEVLEDFRKEGDVFEDEYLYYEAYLSEQLRNMNLSFTAKQAADFVKAYPEFAGEVFRIMEREHQRADVVARIRDHCAIDIGKFSNVEIDAIAARFDKILSNNSGYWESYWDSADAAIAEMVEEKNQDVDVDKVLHSVPVETSNKIVEDALTSIRGVGPDMGSGFYELNTFTVDGEKMELVAEVCKYQEEVVGGEYYGVYYWVGYYDGDSLITGWEYTSQLNVDELKEIVHKLANRDFIEDIRKAMGKESVSSVIEDAKERCVDAGAGESKAQENVKE